MKIVYAGDRDISVRILDFIINEGVLPSALLVSDVIKASHAEELANRCRNVTGCRIMRGDQFRQEEGVSLLREIEPDFLICVHFPYIVPKELLSIPVHGVLNLHPAYLPFNRGWHTPSWAIWDKTQYGATLHFMDEGLDTGDIVAQKGMSVRPDDTADKLYKRIFDLEYDLFKETWPLLMSGKYSRKPQALNRGTEHKKSDLSAIQQINLDERVGAGELIRRLKALTTNNVREAAYFTDNNIKYRIQINVQKEEENQL